MGRVMADCRRWESVKNCSLTIIGEEDEVIEAAAQHAASAHGHTDSTEMREGMRTQLEPESAYQFGSREPEPLPNSGF